MSMSEYTPLRLKSAKIKADQLKDTGAKIVVTSCHNCVDGLADLIKHYKLGMPVTQLVNLVANALVIEEKVVVAVPEVPVVEAAGDLAGLKILVVDDEPDFVMFISTLLEDNGAIVFAAHDGEEAIKLARREKPDLMTLDLSMPGKSGADVFEAIRADKELEVLQIFIVTGQPELRKVIYEFDVREPEGYMNKPVTEDNFLKNVKKLFKIK